MVRVQVGAAKPNLAPNLTAEVDSPPAAPTAAAFTCACVPFAPPSVPLLAGAGIPYPPSPLGEKRLLLYRVDFADFTNAPLSSNAAADLISGLNNFYRDMSYGQMPLALAGAGSTVTELLRLPEPSGAYNDNFEKLIEDCRQTARVAGYPVGNFDLDLVLTTARPTSVFGGIAYVGGPGVWVANSNFNVGVIGHELGHNFGLPHASFWATGDQSSIGPGSQDEYGDPFDSMGVPGGSTSHFNARFKQLLGWIPDADAPWVTSNGVYRIAAHDHPAAGGPRALRIARTSAQNYWVEFRQFFTNAPNRWVTNGASLRWAGNDATNTLLLDTTPGTPTGRTDGAVVIGRTFSDRCLDLHITTLGKIGTTPETLDVAVNRGPFPGNVAPIVAISASATTVAVGATVILQATALDANGDALAYYWDFGDLSFGTNAPMVANVWNTAGEYVARCTVTDMKGGTASASVVLRVGTVTTFLAAGRVLRAGTPVEGVLVKAGPGRFSYSDSDGTYRVSRVAAGRQTMTAVYEGFNVLNAGFENPVTFGPGASGLDFTAMSDALNSYTLVATGSVWKFLDNGVAPAANWTTANFDDSTWKTGRSRLGYGVGGEATIVSHGPDPNNRHLTTWFRRPFTVEDATVVNHLVFRLRRDDGAVVYLNGQELFRENLPAGAIQPTNTALVDVTSVEEPTFFKRRTPPLGLLTGTNVLAVEIHQFRTNSTDLSLDLELTAVSEDPQGLLPLLAVQPSGADWLLVWSAGYSGWTLHYADELPPTVGWMRHGGPVVTSNEWRQVRLPFGQAREFFQLRKSGFCGP